MGIRQSLLALADQVRTLRGPAVFDASPNQLTIRTRTWTSGVVGDGTTAFADSDVVIPQYVAIAQVSTREIASSGGRFEEGDVKIGPITPTYGAGGFTPTQLNPTGAPGREIIYLLTGTHPGEYQLIEARTYKAFSYFLIIRRRLTTP